MPPVQHAITRKCTSLAECLEFPKLALDQRRSIVMKQRACFNCLTNGHRAYACPSPAQCHAEDCRRRHHPLLHAWMTSSESASINSTHNHDHDETLPYAQNIAVAERQSAEAFLGIIPVTLVGPKGTKVDTCALLDNGSTRSFIDDDLASSLELNGRSLKYTVNTLTAVSLQRQGREVDVRVTTCENAEGVVLKNVWTSSNLHLPCSSAAQLEDIAHHKHLRGVPVVDVRRKRVQLIIGASSGLLVPLEVRSPSSTNCPYAERTTLGWVVRGPSGRKLTPCEVERADVHFVGSHLEQLTTDASRLWNTDFDDLPRSDKNSMSVDDQRALAMMEDSVRQVDGIHYEIALPWRNDVDLPCNKAHAAVRLGHVQQRLEHDRKLHDMYHAQMDDYLTKGYARRVDGDDALSTLKPHRVWYLPHHPVFSIKKPDKVRVVFDGAARYKGTSINDHLLQGPDLTNNLAGVLMRFRQEPVALIADITAMFHQVLVPKHQQNALRFLWWANNDMTGPPNEYCMTRHVFGLRSSPSCAAFALQQTANDHGSDSQSITKYVHQNFYVDDLLLSVPSSKEADQALKGLHALLNKGGFKLVKWSTNNRSVLEGIPHDLRAQTICNFDTKTDVLPNTRTLGQSWSPENDMFNYTVHLEDRPSTRRGILSTISSLFDHLGLVCPVLLEAKLILQQITRIKSGWDEDIPSNLQEKWTAWCLRLKALEAVRIPRVYGRVGVSAASALQLHIFCDASEYGIGVCAYLRIETPPDVTCTLAAAKSRLAPIKPTTIPRLELTAAMVASRLRARLLEELDFAINGVTMWTDSSITLGYIRNTTSRFKAFVANRLATVHELTSVKEWRHVPTKNNPADLASRGFAADDHKSMDQWFSGPSFLLQSADQWPIDQQNTGESREDDVEVKATVLSTQTGPGPNDVINRLCLHYSTWERAVRAVIWLQRCLSFLKKKRAST